MKKIIVILVIAVFVCLVITPALAWTVSQGSDPTAIMKGAVRYRNFVLSPGGGTGAEIYLGTSDFNLQSNRIELDLSDAATCDGPPPDPRPACTWIYPDTADPRYNTEFGGGTVHFNYIASTGIIQTRVDMFRVEYDDAIKGYRGFIKHSYCSEYPTGNLGDINYIQIDSVAQEPQTLVGLRCVNLLSLKDGSQRGLDKTADDFESNNILPSVGGWKTTMVKDPLNELKLSDGFNMWGSFNLQGPQPADAETNKLEISIGHYSPADTTPPTTQISIDGDGPHCGWYTTDVVATLTATDGTGSGIDKTQYSFDTGATWTEYTVPFSITSEGITNVAYRSIDKAGNIEPAQNTDVRIDKTPPTIVAEIIETVPPVNDWYPSSVKVRFTASDAISLIRSDPAGGPGHVYIEDKILCADGKGQIIAVTVQDRPGNEATATITVSIDKTPPIITINFPVNCAHYIVNEDIHADWTTSDSLSGIATQSGTVPTGSAIDTATIGSKQFTVTATDMAGNQNTKTVSYTVDSQADATKETITTVDSLEVLPRIKTALKAELNGAVTALTNDRPRIAKVILRAVNLEVKVMSGKQIPADQAAMLIAQIQRINNTI
jgi:hypothetical protein